MLRAGAAAVLNLFPCSSLKKRTFVQMNIFNEMIRILEPSFNLKKEFVWLKLDGYDQFQPRSLNNKNRSYRTITQLIRMEKELSRNTSPLVSPTFSLRSSKEIQSLTLIEDFI